MKLIGAKVTEAQHEAFSAARDASGLNSSDYMLGLFAADYVARGLGEWPDDKGQHGGDRRRQCPVCESYKIIDPYGEWMCKDCGWEIDDGINPYSE